MNYSSLDNLCEELNILCKNDEPMSKYTSFKIGGKADRFIQVNNKEQLIEIMNLIQNQNIPYFIIGNGSNILVSDKGIRAVVLNLVGDFKKIELIDDVIHVGAGAMLSAVSIFAKENSLTGLEFAYGIPATIGGAVYMNAGAYGGEMKDVVVKSFYIDNGEISQFNNDAHEFEYRHSVYNGKNYLITDVYLKLEKGDKADISAKMEDLMFKRKDKQPVNFPSAGSTFKRPTGYFAAALIDECGLKGMSVGGAKVSEKHAGFIINTGGASCEDVLLLIDKVKSEVLKQKEVELECEVKYIGE